MARSEKRATSEVKAKLVRRRFGKANNDTAIHNVVTTMCTDRPKDGGSGGESESCSAATAVNLTPPTDVVDEAEEEKGYGYGGKIDALRKDEFSRLEQNPGGGGVGVAYVDHAGAPPYSELLIRECMEGLQASLLGNPHSTHDAAAATTAAVEAARSATLEHFNAPLGEYEVVFTSGATGVGVVALTPGGG